MTKGVFTRQAKQVAIGIYMEYLGLTEAEAKERLKEIDSYPQ